MLANNFKKTVLEINGTNCTGPRAGQCLYSVIALKTF